MDIRRRFCLPLQVYVSETISLCSTSLCLLGFAQTYRYGLQLHRLSLTASASG